MKLADKILGVPDELAVPDNPAYESYRSGIYRAEGGAILFFGGLAAGAAGLEVAWAPVVAGALVTYWGGMKVLSELEKLDPKNM